jgi:hypothetical protein
MLLNVSCKKEWAKNVTVVKDCTGTYLRVDRKDYQVCNAEKVSSFPNDAIVKVDFKKIQICSSAKTSCMLYVSSK